jgi:hypothetical protein
VTFPVIGPALFRQEGDHDLREDAVWFIACGGNRIPGSAILLAAEDFGKMY